MLSKLECRVPPLVQVAICGAGISLVRASAPGWTFDVPVWVTWPPLLVGLLLAATGVGAFRSAGTTVDPRTPESSRRLVSGGVYRVTRNPMYLGFALVLFGCALLSGNPLTLVFVPIFVLYMSRFQIIPEERALEAVFGDEYRAYANRVRRWI